MGEILKTEFVTQLDFLASTMDAKKPGYSDANANEMSMKKKNGRETVWEYSGSADIS